MMNIKGNIKALSGNASSARTKILKSVPSAGKVMLTLFWDLHGPILGNYYDHGQTVNSAQYCAVLEEDLKPAIRNERRGRPTNLQI
jgi:hypothetical protein